MAIYCTVVDSVIWAGFCYGVFVKGYSGWWFLLAIFASSLVGTPRAVTGKAEAP
jgi:hypothetical protein